MRRRAPGLLLLVIVALAVSACAKKGPPSGGPPDLDPPKLISTSPDSGAAGVPRDASLTLVFSEGMEPRSTGDAVALAPRIEILQRRWKGNTLSLTLAETLGVDRTYTLFVGTGARDRHGNSLKAGASITFSTADSFPPGVISGKIEARGMSSSGIYLWGYVAPGEPDSTARDFDALSFTDADGQFRLAGLDVPAQYRLWAFADLNFNRSFEPRIDVLAPIDTVLLLSETSPTALDLSILVVNPRAEAKVSGAVLDTLGDSLGVIRILAVSAADSTVRLLADALRGDLFEISLQSGTWNLRAFRDVDKNHRWDAGREPASLVLRLDLPPAGLVTDQEFVMRPVPPKEEP